MLPRRQDLSLRGFSLIEIIITLVVGGILGVVIYTLIAANSKNSVQPLIWIKEGSVLVDAMEKINGYYRYLIENNSLDLVEFKNSLENIVSSVDPNIEVDTRFILFDEAKREYEDTEGVHRFLKVKLKKDSITLENLFSQ